MEIIMKRKNRQETVIGNITTGGISRQNNWKLHGTSDRYSEVHAAGQSVHSAN